MTRDIPENVETQLGDDEGIHGAPSPEGSVATSGKGQISLMKVSELSLGAERDF